MTTHFKLEPAGLLDQGDRRVTAHAGALVRKVQPHGCPPNGTMRMAYVETLDGLFIGLVNLASLTPARYRRDIQQVMTDAEYTEYKTAHAELSTDERSTT